MVLNWVNLGNRFARRLLQDLLLGDPPTTFLPEAVLLLSLKYLTINLSKNQEKNQYMVDYDNECHYKWCLMFFYNPENAIQFL